MHIIELDCRLDQTTVLFLITLPPMLLDLRCHALQGTFRVKVQSFGVPD